MIFQAKLKVNRVRIFVGLIIGFILNTKDMLRLLFILTLTLSPCFAGDYGVYKPQNYHLDSDSNEKILFILDFSNSMNESIHGERKVDMMLYTMSNLIPKLDKNISVGLRVYGHKFGFTSIDACRASSLLVPIDSGTDIMGSLSRVKPRGMTPITYSLKQAIKYDFMGYRGKKHIILLTDGGENCDESPCKFVMELVKIRKDVFIDVIAFDISDEDDLSQLQCAALVTNGKFYTANTAAELLHSLNNSVSSKKEVEAKIISNY